MKINNKGFSMIELLLAISLLGILSGIGIQAFQRYQTKARKQAVETLAKSASQAAEDYLMDHPAAKKVDLKTLYEENYISSIENPYNSDTTCSGKVKILKVDQTSSKALSKNIYTVSVCCDENYYTYSYPSGSVIQDEWCKALPYDISKIKEVKVLNVYPDVNANKFKEWMDTYGKGIIKVTPVSIKDFNKNPYGYLGSKGSWKYEVVAFGFYDSNNSKDLTPDSSKAVSEFLDSGGSAIFGHDTIANISTHSNFNKLAKYVNISLEPPKWKALPTVSIVRKGIFTEYPYQIGDVGTTLTIPESHVYGQVAHGNVWITFNDFSGDDADKIYLSTYGSNAFIQTGHMNGDATIDERQIIANIIFYAKAIKFVDEDD